MKRLGIIAALLFLTGVAMQAQKYAFVDTDYILQNIPTYQAAQDELDQLSEQWQEEIEEEISEIDRLYQEFQSEKVLLTEEMKRKKEEEIVSKEREVKELQKKYFGPQGSLFQKREELVKPIQDEIYLTVKSIATEGGYAVIFDTSAGMSMLYNDPKFDKSDEVLTRLGYKN